MQEASTEANRERTVKLVTSKPFNRQGLPEFIAENAAHQLSG